MSEKEVIKRIFSVLIKNVGKFKIYGLGGGGIILALSSIVEPLFFKAIIVFIEAYIKGGSLDISDIFKVMIFWGIFIILFLLLRGAYYFIVRHLLNINFKKSFEDSAERLVNISYSDYLQLPKGAINKKIYSGLEESWQLVSMIFREFIPSIFSIVFAAVLLFIIDWRMAVVTLIFIPFSIPLGIYISKNTRKSQDKIEKFWNIAYDILGDVMNNNPLLKIFSLNNFFLTQTSQSIEKARLKQIGVNFKWILFDNFTKFIIMVSRFLVLGFGVYFILEGTLNLATLFLFFAYIEFIYGPISYIFGESSEVQKKLTRIAKYYELFKENSFEDNEGENFSKKVKGAVEFKNVDFSYVQGKKVLSDLNFTINAGETVAFVGSTGSGKSTITSLLYNFWDVKKGKILIDGQNISKIKKSKLRKHLGIVMQDNLLFNVSIKENLQLVKKDCSDEEIERALKLSQCEFVHDLEKGVDTIVGERGLKLSGGEKQRISIARLILKNPEILILDEATSALDNATEKLIQKSLDNLMKGRTSIIIAHRLSTIKKVDRIFVLDNGSIVEQGNYGELMENKGKFYQLSNPEKMVIL